MSVAALMPCCGMAWRSLCTCRLVACTCSGSAASNASTCCLTPCLLLGMNLPEATGTMVIEFKATYAAIFKRRMCSSARLADFLVQHGCGPSRFDGIDLLAAVVQLSGSLMTLDCAGVVHCDIKLENVLVDVFKYVGQGQGQPAAAAGTSAAPWVTGAAGTGEGAAQPQAAASRATVDVAGLEPGCLLYLFELADFDLAVEADQAISAGRGTPGCRLEEAADTDAFRAYVKLTPEEQDGKC